MRHPEDPAAEIGSRLVLPEVLEQREEYFLDHLFAILRSHAEGEQIAQQRVAKLVEEGGDFLFERRRSSIARG
jgi:hypothetical protein